MGLGARLGAGAGGAVGPGGAVGTGGDAGVGIGEGLEGAVAGPGTDSRGSAGGRLFRSDDDCLSEVTLAPGLA